MDNYYHQSYAFDRKETVVVDDTPLIIYEIVLSNKNRKGYVVTPLEKNEILYFADINYSTSNIYVVDNTTGHTERFHFNPRNPATGNSARTEQMQNFDFFDNLNNPNVSERKFFGWDCGTYYEPGYCYDICCYYVFLIQVGECQEKNPRPIEECP